MTKLFTKRVVSSASIVMMGLTVTAIWAQETDPTDGQAAYRFEEIADGVFFAAGTGVMTTMSNSMVIVNDDHAMLVDTSVTPAAARKLVAEIREEVTEKPILYVFNSHYHFDHAHGNQIFDDSVEIIGHEYVRLQHLASPLIQRTNLTFSAAIPPRIDRLKEQIAAESDAAEREQLQFDLRITVAHWNALQETEVRAPNITYTDKMTLVEGGREVQLHFVGRGHTGGDTMVFLPEERIVFTGDFFQGSPGAHRMAYMGDGFVNEWPASLENLKGLDFDLIVPGHGEPFRDRQQIDDLQNFMRDLWTRVSDLRSQGLSWEEAARRIDMSDYASMYGASAENIDTRAVLRIYEVLQIQHPM